MSIKMHSYNNGSASAKALRDALNIKMLLPDGKGKWKGKAGDILINWGCSKTHPNVGLAQYTNKPADVGVAANKLWALQAFARDEAAKLYNLPFTQRREAAEKWIAEGETVVCRQKLTGHSGEGIVIATTLEELVDAPLYTMYKKKKDEYRIHVFNGEIIDVQRKARKREVEDEKVNWQVRNLDGGFIFARDGIIAPTPVLDAALFAVRSLGLLHGAVDIGHGQHGTYVYEVNTACGLAGSTLTTYELAFRQYLDLPIPAVGADYVAMDANNGRTLIQAAERFNNIVEGQHIPAQPNVAPEPVPAEPAPQEEGRVIDLEADEAVEFRFGNGTKRINPNKFMKLWQLLHAA